MDANFTKEACVVGNVFIHAVFCASENRSNREHILNCIY